VMDQEWLGWLGVCCNRELKIIILKRECVVYWY
jgi:hypothetical protein